MKRLFPLALLALAAFGRAVTTYHVTQNVSSLSFLDSDIFLDFQLTDGAETGVDNSSVRITNLSLSQGSIFYGDRSLPDVGLVTGTSTDFTLHNSLDANKQVVSERVVKFRAAYGATLSYDFTPTSTSLDGPIPDSFVVAMLYHTGSGTGTGDLDYVGTQGDTGLEMVQHVFGGNQVPAAYGVDSDFAFARALKGDGRFFLLGTPVITVAAPVPEPSALAALGLGAAALLRRRRRA